MRGPFPRNGELSIPRRCDLMLEWVVSYRGRVGRRSVSIRRCIGAGNGLLNPAISPVPVRGYVVEDCLTLVSIAIVFGMIA